MYSLIEPAMYIGLGFLAAGLLAVATIPSIHARAVRLTLRRIEADVPYSVVEIKADKDQVRAEFAMMTRRLEISVEQLSAKNASQLAELGKKTATINRLKADLVEKTAAIFRLEVDNKRLKDQLHAAEEEILAGNRVRVEKTLANKLARTTADLDERSVLADTQRIEIVALKTQVDTLRDQLALAHNHLHATGDEHTASMNGTMQPFVAAATAAMREHRGRKLPAPGA
jgi:capsule polysaccharide export protein KpsE/RkpR